MHEKHACPAVNKSCLNCGIDGHFGRMCKKSLRPRNDCMTEPDKDPDPAPVIEVEIFPSDGGVPFTSRMHLDTGVRGVIDVRRRGDPSGFNCGHDLQGKDQDGQRTGPRQLGDGYLWGWIQGKSNRGGGCSFFLDRGRDYAKLASFAERSA
jgi:hypothetical protein